MPGLRGFVGPLGDDLPSIFPIVAAIMLFVGTMVYAGNVITQKNEMLEIRQAALGLSYMVTEKGLIKDRTSFEEEMCKGHLMKYALSNRVRFVVTIKRYCGKYKPYYPLNTEPDPDLFLSPYFLDKNDADNPQGRTWAYCTNIENPPAGGLLKVPQGAVLLSYPVAVSCPVGGMPTNGLGAINVAVWKK